ncbi:MAG: histidine phosphatase family protein [Lachnospiraceae bacterium]|nr:histidine phosphatase family protein [Lachnospiraceae bacterium]
MIYIIRHGQTEMNNRKVFQGRSDVSMNEEGLRQAEEAAEFLKDIRFDKVWSSPLKRAVQTAEIVAPGADIMIDDRLIEMDYGPYEGMDLTDPPPEIVTFFSDFVNNPAPAGMERLDSVVKRTGEFMEERCRTEENVLITTHAIAMKGILEYLTPESRGSYWSKYIGNCAVYVTEYKDGSFTVPGPFDRP